MSTSNTTFTAVLHHCVTCNNTVTTWDFYLRPHALQSAQTLTDKHVIYERSFSNKSTNLKMNHYPHFIVQHNDNDYDAYDWAMWRKKNIKQYGDTKGYWKVLNDINSDIVPIEHLHCILSLLRNNLLLLFEYTDTNIRCKHIINFIFLNESNLDDIVSEYQLIFWNGHIIGATSLSLMVTRSNKRVPYHFMYFPSSPNCIRWKWYSNETDKWILYTDQDVIRSLEASHFGIHEDMFPLQTYHLDEDNLDIHLFDHCSVPALSEYILRAINKMKKVIFRTRYLDSQFFETVTLNKGCHYHWTTKIERINVSDSELFHKKEQQPYYSAFIVSKYIKYKIAPILKRNSMIPTVVVSLCHKYYFQNVFRLILAQNCRHLLSPNISSTKLCQF